ncbi:hypothetical protein HC031_20785 [Planosporangium thailandense]|uniref:Uncharacterized protein n=1 Tax=Planosporangium thailandense TaxID=765197 RepID=A0ABX0Y1B9_9ACTN|nr:hypothetical protein [Planosporangium thailandense]NJC72133.1 hypothetical protein [Planosporangium thailandense]
MSITEQITDDELVARAVAAATRPAPDPFVDAAQEEVLASLAAVEALAGRGELVGDELNARRSALVDALRGSVVRKDPAFRWYVGSVERLGAARFFQWIYLPSDLPPEPVPGTGHRYELAATDPDPLDFTQVKVADLGTGKLFAQNTFRSVPGATSGTARAGLGVLVRPNHQYTRLVFQPEVHYAFGHRVDVPTAQGKVNSAHSRGEFELLALRLNSFGDFESYAGRSVPLWDKYTGTGTGYGWQNGKGQFPGGDPGLSFVGTSADVFAIWVFVKVTMSKQDYDPTWFTTGQAYLDCEVPLMWVEQSALL